ncbi:MAG TPA: hypothetical protein VHY84_14955 [Bryobacteraceae bacterium]|jgi:hypothetical protein|nr:hypothetical protein [Bryobacteraceae bacterium]
MDNTTNPAANPAHPAHASFNWGIFLALLTVGLQATGQVISASHPSVGAAMAGGATVLGTVDQAVTAATQPAAPVAEAQAETEEQPEKTQIRDDPQPEG